ncbi:MAG TPA: GDSL-type esterase/lipase family protein, partial [Sphingomonas sp.]|nr:GDSL-type esterase/lipase family protein [Sphingomonas sp.]
APDYQRQWPGSYFETAFIGTAIYLKLGAGDVILHVLVDDQPPVPLIKPKPGLYLLDGLSPEPHRLRVEVVTEGQAGPSSFGGFYPATGTKAMRLRARARQIEFIGDSHTVGYGNTSPSRQCTADQVWATTDTSRGIAGLIARRYGADYQVNAISGRGVVRNYGGMAADTLPMAYPFVLFDKAQRYSDAGWRPQFIVIALGTNDFSTPLKAGERWATRDALHADYEAGYVRFIQDLRRRNPQARFVLWATDLAGGEIDAEVRKVVDTLRAAGERRIDYVPVRGLAMTGCDFHPSTADDWTIADALSKAIDAGTSE